MVDYSRWEKWDVVSSSSSDNEQSYLPPLPQMETKRLDLFVISNDPSYDRSCWILDRHGIPYTVHPLLPLFGVPIALFTPHSLFKTLEWISYRYQIKMKMNRPIADPIQSLPLLVKDDEIISQTDIHLAMYAYSRSIGSTLRLYGTPTALALDVYCTEKLANAIRLYVSDLLLACPQDYIFWCFYRYDLKNHFIKAIYYLWLKWICFPVLKCLRRRNEVEQAKQEIEKFIINLETQLAEAGWTNAASILKSGSQSQPVYLTADDDVPHSDHPLHSIQGKKRRLTAVDFTLASFLIYALFPCQGDLLLQDKHAIREKCGHLPFIEHLSPKIMKLLKDSSFKQHSILNAYIARLWQEERKRITPIPYEWGLNKEIKQQLNWIYFGLLTFILLEILLLFHFFMATFLLNSVVLMSSLALFYHWHKDILMEKKETPLSKKEKKQ